MVKYQIASATKNKTATPPTAPPAIAPTGVVLALEREAAVMTAEEEEELDEEEVVAAGTVCER